jgi:putative Mg2+ transporter-C (MgtC) family protein
MILTEDLLKLLLAMALGGLIGVERELRDKAAGFRTLMFISAGAALFTIFSYRLGDLTGSQFLGDPGRIAAQIVSGIGFLGAGVILRERGEIRGLTTAATIWLVAAIGMGIGAGYYLFTVLATVLILIALFFFPSIEGLIGTLSQTRTYQIVTIAHPEKYKALTERFNEYGLKMISSHRTRRKDYMKITLIAAGSPKSHEALVEALFQDEEVEEFRM